MAKPRPDFHRLADGSFQGTLRNVRRPRHRQPLRACLKSLLPRVFGHELHKFTQIFRGNSCNSWQICGLHRIQRSFQTSSNIDPKQPLHLSRLEAGLEWSCSFKTKHLPWVTSVSSKCYAVNCLPQLPHHSLTDYGQQWGDRLERSCSVRSWRGLRRRSPSP